MCGGFEGHDEGDHHGAGLAAGSAVSQFEAIGGAATVAKTVECFYAVVLADPELVSYFDGVDLPRIKRHLALVLTEVLGGPGDRESRDLAEAHAGLGITAAHYRKVVSYLTGVLWELGAGETVVITVGATLANVQDQIVSRRDDTGRSA